MYKSLYSKFLKGHEGILHFASHSHHFWPDVSLNGQIESWENAMKLSDKKWGPIFENVLPKTQKHIASILNFSRPSDISFASNTHELITRLLSSLDFSKKIKVLTTKNEFHSFSRQMKRLDELASIEVEYLDNEKEDFTELALKKLTTNDYDLVYFSHVFFNSGLKLELERFHKVIEDFKGLFVIDGYHAFCAVPVDLSKIEDKIFYLAGGYKYAQAGEGVCFMTLPKNCILRPLNTGWFAHFNALETTQSGLIDYAKDGMRFWGSTMDPTGFFRFNAVWEEFSRLGLDVETIHSYVQNHQKMLIDAFSSLFLIKDLDRLGHFLTIEFESEELCRNSYQELEMAKILCDYRGNRLRFGLGTYQTSSEVEYLIQVISQSKFLNLIKK